MKVLVLNAGSSSIKYQVIDMSNEEMLGKGLVERIGTKGSHIKQTCGSKIFDKQIDLKNHMEAFELLMHALVDSEVGIIQSMDEISAIGHRVLHSGEDFTESVFVDEKVLAICKKNIPLGELHMPANISGIESCMKLMPNIPNVAVFDTSFHLTMPEYAYMYAIKYEDYEKLHLRKYGFHGTSHRFVSKEAINYLGNPKTSKIITCHLGNGSSLAAVKNGKCIDTTMGLTPLEGLVMGTRSGDIDPAAIGYLATQKGLTAQEVVKYLNNECGFLGLTGCSDNRDVVTMYENGESRGVLALNLFAYRIRKYIAAYAMALGGLDCIVFTGGIGENSAFSRGLIMKGLEILGVDFNFEANATCGKGVFSELHKPTSKVKVVIIPTNEELVIARDAVSIVKQIG